MTRTTFRTFAALTLVAFVAACSSPVKLDEPAKVESRDARSPGAAAGTTPGGATTGATPQSQVATVDLARQRAEQEASAARAAVAGLPKVIYFDFDSFLVRDEFRPIIEGHAKALVTLRDAKLSLQGHTDERGGREYNLALGQKRAEAVARALELLGVNPAQLEAVSFGEERPAVQGRDEAAWAKNRRVEIKDK